MNRNFELLWLKVRTYFKHPAEEIRQAIPIIPRRLYMSFGYICKAVPLTERERLFIKQTEGMGALPIELLRDIKPGDDMMRSISQLQELPNLQGSDLPSRCNFCAFYHNGLPCPMYNILQDGTTVCDTHKYVILKKQ